MLSQRAQPATPVVSAAKAWWWRHPEIIGLGLAAAAWAALAVEHWSNHDTVATAWRFNPVSWTLMIVAMMLPGIAATSRRLTFSSMWRRRHRSAAIFTATYVGAWVGLGVVAALAIACVERAAGTTFAPGRAVVFVGVVVAAGWQLTAAKRRFLYRCHLQRPVAPRGWKGDRSLIAYGWFHARACMGSCAPIMAVMFVGAHDFHLMVPLAAITTIERYQRRPTAAASAAALLAVAGLSLLPVA